MHMSLRGDQRSSNTSVFPSVAPTHAWLPGLTMCGCLCLGLCLLSPVQSRLQFFDRMCDILWSSALESVGLRHMVDFQILSQPLEDVQELSPQTPPIFHDTVRPWHDGMGTVPHYLGNEE